MKATLIIAIFYQEDSITKKQKKIVEVDFLYKVPNLKLQFDRKLIEFSLGAKLPKIEKNFVIFCVSNCHVKTLPIIDRLIEKQTKKFENIAFFMSFFRVNIIISYQKLYS